MFWESVWAGSCLWPALIVHDIAMGRVRKETNADDMLSPLGRYGNSDSYYPGQSSYGNKSGVNFQHLEKLPHAPSRP